MTGPMSGEVHTIISLLIIGDWYWHWQVGDLFSEIFHGGGHEGEVVGGYCTNDRLQENLSTVLVVFLRVFDKAEAVDVADVALPIVSKQVKPTHCLL